MPDPIPESAEALLIAMIAIDSVNSDFSGVADAEAPLARYLTECAAAMGFETEMLPVDGDSVNLLVIARTEPDAPWILFESHMDTVGTDAMTIDPFGGHVAEGRIYGRGACDTKGSGAAMLWALRRYRSGTDQPNNVAILFSVDEEVSRRGVSAFIEGHLPDLGWRPVGVIEGEPTDLLPVVAHNGTMRWTVRTHGTAAHSCNPAQGRSAISMMAKVIDAIESNYIPSLDVSHPLTGRAQCSINIIKGGTGVNIIPNECEIHMDRRTVPGESADDIEAAMENILQAVRDDHPELEVTQEPPQVFPAMDPSVSRGFVESVQGALRELAMPDEAMGVGYGTDASNFTEAGIPAVVIGPGSIDQAHTCDEWLCLEQLEKAVAVYEQIMRSDFSA